jgi:hypothetical protein
MNSIIIRQEGEELWEKVVTEYGYSLNVAIVKKVISLSLNWEQRAIDIERKYLGNSRRKWLRALAIRRVIDRVLEETGERP